MKVLVTGGAGFLGSHVVDALVKRGYEVVILDLLKSKYAPKGVETIIGDITDKNFIFNAIPGFDIVYHFSGISGIEDCKKSPREAFEINIGGTFNILEACAKFSVKRFVFASSAYVFSKYGYIYRTTKIACENFIHDFSHIYNLKYTNLRYGSLYGRRADDRNTIHRMLKNALIRKKIIYNGTGEEYREYIHVHDAAEMSVDILDSKYENADIIITGNERYKYDDILKMIQEILDDNITIIKKEKKDDCHYTLTPYNYNQNIGKKMIRSEFIDFGQGLLDCLGEISSL